MAAAWSLIWGAPTVHRLGPLPLRGDVPPICAGGCRTGKQSASAPWRQGGSTWLTQGSRQC